MYERILFKNIKEMEVNDISFELDATRCNCDLENCTETCEKAYDCFHGICVCSDYSIDLPERMCHLRRKFKVDINYHFTRLNPKKKGTLQFCLPALLGIHRNSKQKEFFSFSEGFLI